MLQIQALWCTFLLGCLPVLAQSAAGEWRGRIEVPDQPLEVTVRLLEQAGRWSGAIDIPAQNAKALPLTAIAVAAADVRFQIADVPGKPTFAGTLAADGAALTGTFTQGGAALPFALQRSDAAPAAVARLDGLQAWLDETRGQFEVPGCAVAVVRGGDLVATFTSGHRDVASKLPVTADTLFPIGSSTKAFTTAVLATLVGEGKLAWDEPVRRWLPSFTVADAALSDRITPRDLVTHRTGLPRHDLVWYGATFTRADMVARLRHLPLSEDLRAEFQYNNLMYLTAGYLAEHLTGSTWEDLVQQRLLQPLGMTRANFSVAATQRDPDHAKPYRRQAGKIAEIPFRDLTAIGPAGSINASVLEMARWLALHLQQGELDGRRVLARAAIADLHTVRMPMPTARPNPDLVGVGYASGWMVDVYRGHRRVHHGGNIDGFSAMVTLLPDAGIGICVLTNLDACGMHEMVVRQITDRWLGLEAKDWKSELLKRVQQQDGMEQKGKEGARAERRTGTSPSHPLAEYAGDYEHQGYGRGHVVLRDGVLHAEFHGLGGPLEHWHFDVFAYGDDASSPELAGMKLQFTQDLEGEIDALRVVLEPSTPAIVFTRQADARLRDPQFLRTLAGDYDLGTMVATVTLQGDVLVLTLPGQRHELEPGRGLVFALRGMSGYSVRFVTGSDGRTSALRIRQPEGVFEAVRKE